MGRREALADTLATDVAGARRWRWTPFINALAARSYTVEEHLKTLRFLEAEGRIEAARSNDTEHVRGLFEEIGVQVRKAGEELMAFSALATRRDRDGGRGRARGAPSGISAPDLTVRFPKFTFARQFSQRVPMCQVR